MTDQEKREIVAMALREVVSMAGMKITWGDRAIKRADELEKPKPPLVIVDYQYAHVPIGKKFAHEGVILQVDARMSCIGCYFLGKGCGNWGCSAADRLDGKDSIFRRVNPPLVIDLTRDGAVVTMQVVEQDEALRSKNGDNGLWGIATVDGFRVMSICHEHIDRDYIKIRGDCYDGTQQITSRLALPDEADAIIWIERATKAVESIGGVVNLTVVEKPTGLEFIAGLEAGTTIHYGDVSYYRVENSFIRGDGVFIARWPQDWTWEARHKMLDLSADNCTIYPPPAKGE